jgi:hypothetical protein
MRATEALQKCLGDAFLHFAPSPQREEGANAKSPSFT